MDDAADKRLRARLLREEITRRVHDLASKGKIQWREHSFDRMDERGIDTVIAKRALERGDLKGDPEPGKAEDEWIVTMVHSVNRSRDIGVVTVVVGTKRLRVITVEWEDL